MNRTVKIILEVNKEDKNSLLKTLDLFTQSFNQVIETGFKDSISNGVTLHHATYKNLKELYPSLPSNVLIQARVKATETLKSVFALKKKGKKVSQPISKSCPIRYNTRTMKLDWNKQIISLSTVEGRKKFTFQVPKYAHKYIGNKLATADLSYKNGRFQLNVVLDIPTPVFADLRKTVGVDMGITRVAVASNNRFFGEKRWKELENKTFRLKRKLQAKGTKSAKRHLKKLSGKQLRRRTDHDHVVSKRIVQSCEQGTTIVIENLTNIRQTAKQRRGKQNREFHGWSFARLRSFLEYKAEEQGIKTVAVDPRNTSKMCSKCGCVYRHNRKSQSRFVCKDCSFELNADLNASRNIKFKYLAQTGISSLSVSQSIGTS